MKNIFVSKVDLLDSIISTAFGVESSWDLAPLFAQIPDDQYDRVMTRIIHDVNRLTKHLHQLKAITPESNISEEEVIHQAEIAAYKELL